MFSPWVLLLLVGFFQLQKIIDLSTIKVEYIVIKKSSKEMIWL